MTRICSVFVFAIFMVLILSPMASSDQLDNTLSMIESLAKSSDSNADQSLVEAVIEKIETDSANVANKLIPRLKNESSTEKQLAVYVWALGLTKNQSAVEGLTQLYLNNKSELVRGNCLRALAAIGGKKAGDFILTTLDATADRNMRFNLLNLLGQMQCEQALPKTEEILKLDAQQFYWKPIFIFGKMGDKAVPFLITKINDKDSNVRANAINILGQWLIAPEAAKPIVLRHNSGKKRIKNFAG
jgi:HEAT repeat protein